MVSNELISIGLPVYNCEDYLINCINSIKNQTYQNWELIIINDGSSDKSMQICQNFSNNDQRIKIFDDKQNKGLAIRLNESIQYSKGKFYCRMDSDDVMSNDRLEKILKFYVNNSFNVVGSFAISIDRNNIILGLKKVPELINSNFKSVVLNGFFIHPTIFAETRWFLDNPYNESYERAQDYELWVRTSQKNKFGVLNEALLFYREPNSNNFEKYLKAFKANIKTVSLHKENIDFTLRLKFYVISFFKICYHWINFRTNLFKNKKRIEISNNERELYKKKLNISING